MQRKFETFTRSLEVEFNYPNTNVVEFAWLWSEIELIKSCSSTLEPPRTELVFLQTIFVRAGGVSDPCISELLTGEGSQDAEELWKLLGEDYEGKQIKQ